MAQGAHHQSRSLSQPEAAVSGSAVAATSPEGVVWPSHRLEGDSARDKGVAFAAGFRPQTTLQSQVAAEGILKPALRTHRKCPKQPEESVLSKPVPHEPLRVSVWEH